VGAASGALWGMLFFVPFLGGVMGALFGKLAKSGVNDTSRKQPSAM
jgi:uncharacterized membrane protein